MISKLLLFAVYLRNFSNCGRLWTAIKKSLLITQPNYKN